ncbi:hypothetical protein M513_10044 [Trichuris suis]|uniref:Uncharacterized protein n=1 Tax=Trichuris suis TaxID=68888 RepID=A0A085LVV6_9BILA|nr:hypothetical protein M513_10044 [Trichuris suis]
MVQLLQIDLAFTHRCIYYARNCWRIVRTAFLWLCEPSTASCLSKKKAIVDVYLQQRTINTSCPLKDTQYSLTSNSCSQWFYRALIRYALKCTLPPQSLEVKTAEKQTCCERKTIGTKLYLSKGGFINGLK